MYRILLGSLLIVGAISCRDAVEPKNPRNVATVSLSRNTIEDTTAWNTYGYDVSTVVHRLGANGQPRMLAELATSHHVERTLVSGRWRTTIDFQPSSIRSSPSAAAQRVRGAVSRLVDDGDGSPPRLYDATGTILHVPNPPPTGLPSSGALPKPARFAGPRHDPLQDRSAINSFLLTPEALPARRAAILRALGEPEAGGTETRAQYTVRRDSSVTTFAVDPSIGAPIEITERRQGTVSFHMTFDYERGTDGVATLSRTRSERPASGARTATITETTYRNIHLSRSK